LHEAQLLREKPSEIICARNSELELEVKALGQQILDKDEHLANAETDC
jgi:hypothetical protein